MVLQTHMTGWALNKDVVVSMLDRDVTNRSRRTSGESGFDWGTFDPGEGDQGDPALEHRGVWLKRARGVNRVSE